MPRELGPPSKRRRDGFELRFEEFAKRLWGIKELRYGFGDGPINHEEIQTLREIADWIAGEYVNAKKIGVRCQAGINRSSLCVGLFMIRHLDYSAEEAIDLIRMKRCSDALFNLDFVNFLKQEASFKSLAKLTIDPS